MDYRLYTFVNSLYMNEKQFGIQTAHLLGELAFKHPLNTTKGALVRKYATEHKTIIMCQGLNVGTLKSLETKIEAAANVLELPWHSFYEDQESLGGVITCVGVIVPDKIFSAELVSEKTDIYENVYTSPYAHEISLDWKGGWVENSYSLEIYNAYQSLSDIIRTARLA